MALLRWKMKVNRRAGGDQTSEVTLNLQPFCCGQFACLASLTAAAVRSQKQTRTSSSVSRETGTFQSFLAS